MLQPSLTRMAGLLVRIMSINRNIGTTQNKLSAAFKALGNPHRLDIIRILLRREWNCCDRERPLDCTLDPASCNVGELALRLRIAPSTTSHHLKELEAAEVIERSRNGRRIYCRANAATFQRMREILETADRGGC